MELVFRMIFWMARAMFRSKAEQIWTELALRQQLCVYKRTVRRPKIRQTDRQFWVALKKIHDVWDTCLAMVSPETVKRWHRRGFAWYWRWKSLPLGRPPISKEIRGLIRRMSMENPLWGSPRIQAEMEKLGYTVTKSTVEKYMMKRRGGGTKEGWRRFILTHLGSTAAMETTGDIISIPTVYGLHHEYRRAA